MKVVSPVSAQSCGLLLQGMRLPVDEDWHVMFQSWRHKLMSLQMYLPAHVCMLAVHAGD